MCSPEYTHGKSFDLWANWVINIHTYIHTPTHPPTHTHTDRQTDLVKDKENIISMEKMFCDSILIA